MNLRIAFNLVQAALIVLTLRVVPLPVYAQADAPVSVAASAPAK